MRNRRAVRAWVAGLLPMLSLTSAVCAADVPLVRDGRSDYAIHVAGDETPSTTLAAAEIARYLNLMTGVDLPIKQGSSNGPAIVLSEWGKDPRQGGPGPRTPDDYRIEVVGRDVTIQGSSGRALLHATYAFLDSLGCRFLAPALDHYNGAAEVIPTTRNLTFSRPAPPSRDWSSPAMTFRKLYVEEGISHTETNLRQIIEWMPKVGYNTLVIPTDYQGHGRVKWDNWRDALTPELQKRGILIEVGGHGYQNFLNAAMEDGALFRRHPEWFAQDASGVRQKSRAWVPCTSNPGAVKALTDNFLAYIKDRPEIQIFDFWPPDGAKWCECDPCKALGTPPDRQAILLAHVKRAVAPIRPDLRLEVIAYSSYLSPPETQTVDPSVLVDFCPISQQFDHAIDDPAATTNAKYADALRAWRKKFSGDLSVYTYYRKYAWDSLPAVIPHYMQHDLKWYMTLPVQGVSTYAEPGDWFTYELNHYVLAALAWDPGTDVDALVRKFATARYGPAADTAIEAYRTLEDVVRVYTSIPHTSRRPPAQLAAAQQRLEQSRTAVRAAGEQATDPGVRRNLARLVLMFDYAIEDIAIQQLIAQRDPTARNRAVALHQWVQSHADAGTFLITAKRLSQARMLKRLGLADPAGPAPTVPE